MDLILEGLLYKFEGFKVQTASLTQ